MKPTRTLILVADGQRSRALMSEGPSSRLQEVPEFVHENPLPRTSDLVTDRLPRTHDSVGQGRHAVEPHSDPHRELKASFAVALAKELDRLALAKAYDRVVLVAPPAFLGDLRHAISAHVRALIHGEVAKDLTHVPDTDIRPHLGDVVA